jgi:hypothetical protein
MQDQNHMILGYQIQDQHGDNWAERPSHEILTQATAINELKEARAQQSTSHYNMIVILKGDIEDPTFESHLASTEEQYKTLAVSTSHILLKDHDVLTELAASKNVNTITERETGWFVKLYDDAQRNGQYPNMSVHFNAILVAAFNAGFRMVEFDVDATLHDDMPIFNH